MKLEKFEEILKDNIVVRFENEYLDADSITTLNKYINHYKEKFSRKIRGTIITHSILKNCKESRYIYYILPLSYEEMLINNFSLAKEIIIIKFKDKTLNKLYEEINIK